MATFMTRYMRGDCRHVWAELTHLDFTTCTRTDYVDAIDVAGETMRRVRANIELLVQRLSGMEYRFGYASLEPGLCFFLEDQLNPPPAFTMPDDDISERLSVFEQWCGPLPVAMRAWYEVMGSVNLVGTLPGGQLNAPFTRSAYPPKEIQTPSALSDPLWIYPFPSLTNLIDQRDAWQSPITRIEIAPDQYFKSGQPGGGSSYVPHEPMAPPSADGMVIGERQPMWFVDYLREYLAWGGYPGLRLAGAYRAMPREITELTDGFQTF